MKIGRSAFIFVVAVLAGLGCVVLRAQQMYPQAKQGVLDEATVAADDKIMAEIKDHNEIMSNLEYLSDMIGQRLTGSENLKKANDWTKERFSAYGAENAHLESWQIAHSWTRGTARGRIVSPAEHPLTMAAYGWTPSTNGVMRGPIMYVNAQSMEELQQYKGKLKNAILITAEPAPLARARCAGNRPHACGLRRSVLVGGAGASERAADSLRARILQVRAGARRIFQVGRRCGGAVGFGQAGWIAEHDRAWRAVVFDRAAAGGVCYVGELFTDLEIAEARAGGG